MNDQQQTNNSPARDAQPDGYDWRSERYQRRQARRQARAARRGGAWVGGAVLIAVGILLLLQTLTSLSLEKWWSLILLIPAAGAFANSWRIYQRSDHLSAAARASLLGGILLTMVTAIFLLDLDWTIFGPILIILGGLGLLVSAILPR
jgi:hypothetical protein